MSTRAQIAANQANAQKSTGPKTTAGKAASARNNFRHGFTGAFSVLPHEDQSGFDQLLDALRAEHQPSTATESLLVEGMAQHYWLKQRALRLQNGLPEPDEKQLTLYLRYQTTNDRAFHKCLDQLLRLRAEQRKLEIGFESQERKKAEETRRQASEIRRQERHPWALLLAQAKADHQHLQNLKLAPPEYSIAAGIERTLAAERTTA